MPGPRPQHYISESLPRMLESLQQQPWMKEFNDFVGSVLGPRPSIYARAQYEWDAAVVGALLSHGYIIHLMGGLPDPEGEGESAGAEEAKSDTRVVTAAEQTTFTVLGPDGTVAVEGVTGT